MTSAGPGLDLSREEFELEEQAQAALALISMQERAQPSASLLLVKSLLDIAGKRVGPLKADGFELLIRRAILELPHPEQIEINQFLATLPEDYLKKLNNDGKGFGTELKDAAVGKAVENGVVQLATTAVTTLVATPFIGPFAAPAVGGVVGAATAPVITECAKVVGKKAATVVNSSTAAKVGEGLHFAYGKVTNGVASILPLRERSLVQPEQPIAQELPAAPKPDIFIT